MEESRDTLFSGNDTASTGTDCADCGAVGLWLSEGDLHKIKLVTIPVGVGKGKGLGD